MKIKQINIIVRSIILALLISTSIYLYVREDNSGREKCKIENACGKCNKSETCKNANLINERR